MKRFTILVILMALVSSTTFSQTENKANYEESKSEFFKKMKKD